MSKGIRPSRVSSEIKEVLPGLITKNVRDPRFSKAGLFTLNHVELNKDLSVAHVYISFIGGDDSAIDGAVAILSKVSPALRGQLGRSLAMKHAPQLRFRSDPGPEMHQKLADLNRSAES